jgi:hypothetical protein
VRLPHVVCANFLCAANPAASFWTTFWTSLHAQLLVLPLMARRIEEAERVCVEKTAAQGDQGMLHRSAVVQGEAEHAAALSKQCEEHGTAVRQVDVAHKAAIAEAAGVRSNRLPINCVLKSTRGSP